MIITGLGTATPPHRYLQSDCLEALQESAQVSALRPRSRQILERVLQPGNGIDSRYLALPDLADAFCLTPDALHRRFLQNAPELAVRAAQAALADARLAATDLDAVIISTCTGYLCPGLTSYVSEALGLRPEIIALDLVGQGCGAALPNLRQGQALILAGQAAQVLCICVEVCSAAFYLDDDPGVLISACLFGDGAAAAVLSAAPQPGRRRITLHGFRSLLDPGDRELLRFEHRQGMLRNILSLKVPQRAAEKAADVFAQTLQDHGLAREAVTTWIWHVGGRNVLDALQATLSLADSEVQYSRAILREYGNMSSPSVLFVLKAALDGEARDGMWWMSAFGAGFSCHGALLEVTSA